jgi:hypothetical protein
MHGGPIETERIRDMRISHPRRPERRTIDGAVAFVGLLAAGVLALSSPIATAVAVGAVLGARWLVDRPTTGGLFTELKRPERFKGRSTAHSTERGRP